MLHSLVVMVLHKLESLIKLACEVKSSTLWHSALHFHGCLQLVFGTSAINTFQHQLRDILYSTSFNPCVFLWGAWRLISDSNICPQPVMNCSNVRTCFTLSYYAHAVTTYNRSTGFHNHPMSKRCFTGIAMTYFSENKSTIWVTVLPPPNIQDPSSSKVHVLVASKTFVQASSAWFV